MGKVLKVQLQKMDYIVATAKDQKTLLVRMAPSSVDFTGQSFILVNSKGNSQDWLALNSAVAYNKVLAQSCSESRIIYFLFGSYSSQES
ncbi:hypothetical protein E1I95_25915 [Phocaeicola dorei]|nr:hypothetical protein E1I95_25915 [Phocaeicola dorei]